MFLYCNHHVIRKGSLWLNNKDCHSLLKSTLTPRATLNSTRVRIHCFFAVYFKSLLRFACEVANHICPTRQPTVKSSGTVSGEMRGPFVTSRLVQPTLPHAARSSRGAEKLSQDRWGRELTRYLSLWILHYDATKNAS